MKAEIIVKLKIDKHEVSLTLSEVKELYDQLKELVDKQYYPFYPAYPYYPYSPWATTWVSTATWTDGTLPDGITANSSSASFWAVAK